MKPFATVSILGLLVIALLLPVYAQETVKELVKILTGRDDVAMKADAAEIDITGLLIKMLAIEAVSGTEEATNAGIPSAAASLFLGRSGIIRFKGSTPLGTSAGEDEDGRQFIEEDISEQEGPYHRRVVERRHQGRRREAVRYRAEAQVRQSLM